MPQPHELSAAEAARQIRRWELSPVSLALSVPCGFTSNNLPIGLQIAGRPLDEATVLRAGHAYEQATDWHTRRPPV